MKGIELKNLSSEDFLGNLAKVLGGDSPTDVKDLEDYIRSHSFDINKIPPDESHIIFYNGIPIGSRGNILAITGKAKSRKTVVASAIATSTFIEGEFIGFTSRLQPDDKVYHLDSEQGYYHYYHSQARVFRDAGLGTNVPPNYMSIHTRDATVELRKELLVHIMEKHKPRVMILDGITDFCLDINDQKEATKLSELLMNLSYTYDALIIVVIHTTKTTGYMTGALGTTLEKKAQTVLKVERYEDVVEDRRKADPNLSHISCQYARDKGFPQFTIGFDEKLGRYDRIPEHQVVQKGVHGDKSPDAYPEDTLRQIINRAFLMREYLDDVEILVKIERAFKEITGEPMAGSLRPRWRKFLNDRGYIFQNPAGAWMRTVVNATSNHDNGPTQTGLFDDVESGNGIGANASPDDTTTDDLPF
jgi:KaiC/GvpD/RAD55 family RecA-like ATPase